MIPKVKWRQDGEYTGARIVALLGAVQVGAVFPHSKGCDWRFFGFGSFRVREGREKSELGAKSALLGRIADCLRQAGLVHEKEVQDMSDDWSAVPVEATPEDIAEMSRLRFLYAIERAEAAEDRIEELEAANRGLVRLNETTEARAETAEAKLAKAVGMVENSLEQIDALNTLPPDENGHHWRASDLLDQEVMHLRATLAELTASKGGE